MGTEVWLLLEIRGGKRKLRVLEPDTFPREKGKWGNSLFKMEEWAKVVSVWDGEVGAVITKKTALLKTTSFSKLCDQI